MTNVVQLKPITDEEIEKAILLLDEVDITTLPEAVQAALQQLAIKILRGSI